MSATTLGAKLRKIDLYALLGISPEADTQEIRRAYRRAALTCHPDKHPNDREAAERFVQVTQARDVLLDPQARMAYDQLRDRYASDGARDEDERPRHRRRGGSRWERASDPLSEHRLADRAQKSRMPAELTRLWQIGSVVVRAAILRNVACPVALFNDPQIEAHWMLGLEAACRAQCPPDVLEKLASSFERSVAMAVATHPATPEGGLLVLAKRHRDLGVLAALAAHRNAGAEVLRLVSRAVRGPRTLSLGCAVLANPACPSDVAQRIRARLGPMVA
jgi:hypothetical protein